MAFNGSGLFVRLYSWVNDALAGTKIRADRMDNEMNGFATGLSTCLTKDGQTTVTADLPMAGFKHTGVGNASAADQYATYGQLVSGSSTYIATVGGTGNAITLTSGNSFAAYAAGMTFTFKASAANTTAATVALDGLTAKAIVKRGSTALASNDILSGALVLIEYDGTNFQLLSMRQIRTSDIEDNQITTAKILDANVTTAKILDANVTNAKLANMAASTFKMRATASTGAPEDGTATQATAALNAMIGDSGSGGTKGLVPAPASGDASANKYLKADGTWAVVANTSTGRLLGVTRFTSSGTWTKSTLNPSFVVIKGWGGGGGGGGAAGGSSAISAAGAGGAGGYFDLVLASGSLSATETVTIGTVGSNGTSAPTNGSSGGNTSFGSHATANGGSGGTSGAAACAAGGAGGTATGGNINITGNPGENGSGLFVSGASLFASGGNGGSGPVGGSGKGGFAVTTSTQQAGTSATANSGSGGGGGASGSSTGVAGGSGATGYVEVYEYA